MTVDQGGTVVQRDDYYPFGLTFNHWNVPSTADENRYKYNGKEHQPNTEWLDYGARMYQADLGRWFNVDPLAIGYTSFSPYSYVLNRPITYIDPDGLSVNNDYHFDSNTGKTVEVETDSPDRLFVDGKLVAEASYDGEWKGSMNVDEYFSDYSLFFNSKFGDKLLNDQFFAKQLKALGGNELKRDLITARVRQAIGTYGTEVVYYILEVFGEVATFGELKAILSGLGSIKTVVKKAIKDRKYKKGLKKILKEIDELIDRKLCKEQGSISRIMVLMTQLS